ncbi:MAG: hypothetical protein H3C34_10260 [Caldilineaceae bacterium]|nr:hypothetical protein [Caldilineaceae bacterium]
MLRQMLRSVLSQSSHFPHVLEISDDHDLPFILRELRASWLVVSLTPEGRLPQAARQALAEHPEISVLAIAPDGDYVEVYPPPRVEERPRYQLRDVALTDLFSILQDQAVNPPESASSAP